MTSFASNEAGKGNKMQVYSPGPNRVSLLHIFLQTPPGVIKVGAQRENLMFPPLPSHGHHVIRAIYCVNAHNLGLKVD